MSNILASCVDSYLDFLSSLPGNGEGEFTALDYIY